MRPATYLLSGLLVFGLSNTALAQDDEPGPKPSEKTSATPCSDSDPVCVCGKTVRRRWARVAKRIKYVFYRCDNRVAWYPTLAYRLDFGPTFGLRAFHKDLFGNREAAVLSMRMGGRYIQAYRVDLGFPRLADGRYYATGSAGFSDAGNLIFRGFGNAPPGSPGAGSDPRDVAVETRFKKTVLNLTGRAGRNLRRGRHRVQLGTLTSVNALRFAELDSEAASTSIEQVYDLEKLPGFTDGANVFEILAEVWVDSRDRAGPRGQGWQLRLFAGGAPPVQRFRYTRHGGELAYSHRFGGRHLASARLVHETVFGSAENIPFTAQPRLGGINLLRGYAEGSFRDRLAVVGVVGYELPIWRQAVAAALFADVGKVGRSYGELLGARNLTEHWQPGVGVGLILQPTPDVRIRLAVSHGEGIQLRFSSTLASFSHGRGYFP